jgi:hypothetical protein
VFLKGFFYFFLCCVSFADFFNNKMKGYILIRDIENGGEWYYLTIETSHLQSFDKVVVDERFAQYWSSNFIIKKITSCCDKNKKVMEIKNGLSLHRDSIFNAKVGETKNKSKHVIYKTYKPLRYYLQFFNEDSIQNGCIRTYNINGSPYYKKWIKRGKTVKIKEYFSNRLVTRNFKKNETCVIANNFVTTYTCIVFFNNTNILPQKIFETRTYYQASFIISSIDYAMDGKVELRHRYSKTHKPSISSKTPDGAQPFHGIICDVNYKKSAVYWFHKLISYNLQTWYHTPWNFTLRKEKQGIF